MEIENGIIDNPTFIELASTKQDSFYIYIYIIEVISKLNFQFTSMPFQGKLRRVNYRQGLFILKLENRVNQGGSFKILLGLVTAMKYNNEKFVKRNQRERESELIVEIRSFFMFKLDPS